MAEKKNTNINMFRVDSKAQKARKHEIAAARSAYPDTPEHFRDTVRRAVQAQFSGQGYASQAEHITGQKYTTQTEHIPGQEHTTQTEHIPRQEYATQTEYDSGRKHTTQTEHIPRQEYITQTEYDSGQPQSPETEGQPLPDSCTHHGTRKSRRRGSYTGRKHYWHRYLLPAAAIMVIGGAAVAAGSGWLREQLMGRGFSQEEADALVMTEPQQQVTEMDVSEFPEGTVKEKDWDEPLLTVSEAYFDGTTLYFLADPSEEALSYDLYLKDHASINGHDSLTSLQKLEGEDRYLGQIELWDKQYVDEILGADSVSVTMRIVANPKYEGNLLYTWKDSEAYEKIFETGAFKDEDGIQYYIVSAEEAHTGYTPHKLTVEMPLTDSAKEVIEQYLENGGLEEVKLIAPTEETSPTEENISGESAVNSEQDNSLSVGPYTADNTSSEDSESAPDNVSESGSNSASAEDTKATETEPQITVDGGHAICTLPGPSGDLLIDAQFVQDADVAYTGTLKTTEVSADTLKSLYPEGDPLLWKAYASETEDNSWQYQDQLIFSSCIYHYIHYQNDNNLDSSSGSTDSAREQQLCKDILGNIGLETIITPDEAYSDDTVTYYYGQSVLEGLPVAFNSQWPSEISIQMENGQLASLNAPAPLEVTGKEEAALMEPSEMLKHVADYVASGDITPPPSGQPVTKIALEYYVDLTKQGIVFRPIWNFKIPYLLTEEGPLAGRENYFYIDAITGAFVRNLIYP